MTEPVERTIEILEGTPGVLRSLLTRAGRPLPGRWTMQNYGQMPDGRRTWSPFDVVGHLIHGERTDWIPRARLMLDNHDPENPPTFEPFDRYAQYEASRGKSIIDLLDEFGRLRAENIATLRAWDLTERDLARTGGHPELGPVTMAELLNTWPVHDLHHVAQIAKAMARQLKGRTGAWEAYLGILG